MTTIKRTAAALAAATAIGLSGAALAAPAGHLGTAPQAAKADTAKSDQNVTQARHHGYRHGYYYYSPYYYGPYYRPYYYYPPGYYGGPSFNFGIQIR